MSFISNLEINRDFAAVIKKRPQIFDEVFIALSSDNTLPEKELLLLKKDLFFTLLVVVMVENGFKPIVNDWETFDPGQIDHLRLSKWKLSSGLYEAVFSMLGNSEISIKLILIPLGTTALVNAVINEIAAETYSVCLPIDKHFVFSNQATEVEQMFCNLQQLSDTFKNKIVSPVKSKILSICGYPGPSLIELPEDIFLKIMLYLPVTDIVNVAVTSKKCNRCISDDNFWHKLFLRDYHNLATQSDSIQRSNWRLSYINQYKSEMNSKHSRLPLMQIQRNCRGRLYEMMIIPQMYEMIL